MKGSDLMVLGYGRHESEIKAYCIESGIKMEFYEPVERERDLLRLVVRCRKSEDISGVIIWDSDDFGDNEIEYYYWLQEFVRWKINVIVVNELYDLETVGIMKSIATYAQGMAQMKGTIMGQIKAEMTGIKNGAIPYGYQRIGDTLKIIPREAEAIRLAFKMHEAGDGWAKIRDTLNRRGYTSKKGAEIGDSTIRAWFRNERFYRGEFKLRGEWVAGKHEPILR